MMNKTYYIKQFKDWFIQHISGVSGVWEGALGSRVEWDHVIENTFGTSGKVLVQNHTVFGDLFGSIACIRAAIRNAEPPAIAFIDFLPRLDDKRIAHGAESSGLGFVSFVLRRLPELKDFKYTMSGCLNDSFVEARARYTDAYRRVELLCGCHYCLKDNSSSEVGHGGAFCLVSLALSLVRTLQCLSFVQLDVEQAPYRAGFLIAYDKTLSSSAGQTIDIQHVVVHPRVRDIFNTAEAIYTGARKDFPPPVSSAISSRGNVLYLGLLTQMSDDPEDISKVHVVPGVIALDSGRMSSCILDGAVMSSIFAESAKNYQPLLNLDGRYTGTAGLTLKMLVREAPETFHLTMQIFKPDYVNPVYEFGPRHLLETMLAASWKVHCQGYCCSLGQDLPPLFDCEGEGPPDPYDVSLGRSIVVRRLKGNELARCWTLLCQFNDGTPLPNTSTILRQNECLSCCIKAAFTLRKKTVYIIE